MSFSAVKTCLSEPHPFPGLLDQCASISEKANYNDVINSLPQATLVRIFSVLVMQMHTTKNNKKVLQEWATRLKNRLQNQSQSTEEIKNIYKEACIRFNHKRHLEEIEEETACTSLKKPHIETQSSPEMPLLFTLPKELLSTILSMLHANTLLSVASTCKRFLPMRLEYLKKRPELVLHFYKNTADTMNSRLRRTELNVRAITNDQIIQADLTHQLQAIAAVITSIRIQHITNTELTRIVNHLPQLEKIHLLEYEHLHTDDINNVLLHTPNLKTLELDNCPAWIYNDLKTILSKVPKLETLSLKITSNIQKSGEEIAQAIQGMSHLTNLTLGGNCRITCNDMGYILQSAFQLQSLTLWYNKNTKGDEVLNSLKHNSNLKTLQVLLHGITDIGLENLQHLPNLQSLNLSVDHFTTLSLTALQHTPHLQRLTLYKGPTSNVNFENLQFVPQLKVLDILGELSKHELHALSHQLKKVTTLNCSIFSLEQLFSLVAEASSLQEVNLQNCSRMLSKDIAQFRQRYPNIKVGYNAVQNNDADQPFTATIKT